MTSASYDIRTGEFTIWEQVDDGGQERAVFFTNGYAGRGKCRNNPACQHVRNEGPIPIGDYRIQPIRHPTYVEPVFRLVPVTRPLGRTHEMHGRSGFLIHGDNATHDASQGCIILWRSARQALAASGATRLEVFASQPSKTART